ncbi:unnamed protein product [Chrysodeixis includens]|uniref:Uncharacterized protein n=1 Tax=Chrysodeixis includens TaxID=689277 RepID=A0A9N8KYE0_CHRIL|nr:unnamed protein product [Chrysodeixis includens]
MQALTAIHWLVRSPGSRPARRGPLLDALVLRVRMPSISAASAPTTPLRENLLIMLRKSVWRLLTIPIILAACCLTSTSRNPSPGSRHYRGGIKANIFVRENRVRRTLISKILGRGIALSGGRSTLAPPPPLQHA